MRFQRLRGHRVAYVCADDTHGTAIMIRAQVLQRAQAAGLRAVPLVLAPGECSMRGDVVDLYPMAADAAVRLEFLDRTLESILRLRPVGETNAAPSAKITAFSHGASAWKSGIIARDRRCRRRAAGSATSVLEAGAPAPRDGKRHAACGRRPVMKTTSTDDLIRWLDAGEDLLLIDVLPEERFDKKHIPGAVNVPASADDFAERVAVHTHGKKEKKVVVYCSSEACDASPSAARKLDQAGFKQVFDYEAGIEAYEKAGRKLAGSAM